MVKYSIIGKGNTERKLQTMPYERTEVSAREIERQKEICARVRAALGGSERFAMVDTYGCQQNESDSEVLRGYLRSMG